MAEPTRILFVCLGNIVRSPLAENMFRHLAEEAGVSDSYQVASAGTAAYHVGDPPDARMRSVAAARGLIYTGSGRQVRPQDFDDFDLIIPMDTDNQADLLLLANSPEQEAKIHLMREFDPDAEGEKSVPDPYYGGQEGFEHVYDIIQRATLELLGQLESGKLGDK